MTGVLIKGVNLNTDMHPGRTPETLKCHVYKPKDAKDCHC